MNFILLYYLVHLEKNCDAFSLKKLILIDFWPSDLLDMHSHRESHYLFWIISSNKSPRWWEGKVLIILTCSWAS